MTDYLRLALTPGEPSGIGPDLCLQIAQHALPHELIAIADPDMLQERANRLGLSVKIRVISSSARQAGESLTHEAGTLTVLPVPLAYRAQAGKLDPRNAQYVLNTLETAGNGCLNGDFDAMITAPVHKGVINDAGIPFTGHTEFLEALTHSKKVVMMLATEGLRVALATTHLPLRAVPDAITPELLREITEILVSDLQHSFGLYRPRILVAGLNPHAGESGHMGREEIDVIIPTLEQLRQELNAELIGPLPADTLFTEHHLAQADAVLAMYHDQGLPVLKYKGFGNAVNITLGMPIIRTSVDHGTALDLAGTGKADSGSLMTAIRYAGMMAGFRKQILKNS